MVPTVASTIVVVLGPDEGCVEAIREICRLDNEQSKREIGYTSSRRGVCSELDLSHNGDDLCFIIYARVELQQGLW